MGSRHAGPHLFKKGERPVGRKKGTPNKRTVEVRSVLLGAAREIGGMERLVAWIKESPQHEYAFWTTMYPRLLPVNIQGSGPRGELQMTVEIKREDLVRKLEERGLPTFVFGVDRPTLELEAQRRIEGNGADERRQQDEASGGNNGDGAGPAGPVVDRRK